MFLTEINAIDIVTDRLIKLIINWYEKNTTAKQISLLIIGCIFIFILITTSRNSDVENVFISEYDKYCARHYGR